MILAGDIGGTKTVLALFEETPAGLRQLREAVFQSTDHAEFEDILQTFLGAEPDLQVTCACFGVAGPVVRGTVRTTNLPWTLAEDRLAQATGIPRVILLNDLEAAAFGMLFLGPGEWDVLHPGTDTASEANIAVVAPGTGLGEAMLFWDGSRYHPIASEGGHREFGPRTDLEVELLRALRQRFGSHVSYERVLSGAGIGHIYDFLRDRAGAEEPDWLRDRLANGDRNAVISEVALANEHPLCTETLQMFCAILGAEAGNLALSYVAKGGVFIGGGIPPKILPALREPAFLEAYGDKGRFRDFVLGIEVRVALNPRAPLLGAAHYPGRA